MLSKSQARLFFVTATTGFSLVFLWLTVDSMQSLPERSHTSALTPEVVRGKTLWDENNCMGCHTLLGEGAYYAPELTRVYTRRGPEWMSLFLKDPAAMFPGERKMVQYDFSDQQIADLVSFFKWIGEIDTNGFPRAPDMVPVAAAAVAAPGAAPAEIAPGSPEKFRTLCVSCHSVGGQGGVIGPALDGVASRRDEAYLNAWLSDPMAVKPDSKMPKMPMSDTEKAELVTYLLTLH